MLFIKKLAVGLWESIVDTTVQLLTMAVKSLFYGPAFYGINWLVTHHGPSHDMWFGFFMAAFFFTNVNKKKHRSSDEEGSQQPSAPEILPASKYTSLWLL